jgi:hypothetical protein
MRIEMIGEIEITEKTREGKRDEKSAREKNARENENVATRIGVTRTNPIANVPTRRSERRST